ncbi:MAG TPA: hypothetical protein DIU15_06830, partial [Deltaproteobacteria bacterium]|nr:hypothetical protein [Deltaproteobacteria bacterium]
MAPEDLAVRMRTSAVLVLFLLLWLCVIARATYLALGPAPRLDAMLEGQHESIVTVAAQRGSILDRMGRPLAVS